MNAIFLVAAVALTLAVLIGTAQFWGWRWAMLPAVVTLLAVTLALPPWPRPIAWVPDSVLRARTTQRIPQSTNAPPQGKVPAEELADGYVSSRACRECHAEQHTTWHASYHRTMTQLATPETVFGDFADRKVQVDRVTYELFRRGEEFWVRATAPASAWSAAQVLEQRIVLATGSHHMQVYWAATGPGRSLGELPLYYWKEDGRWITREASFLTHRSSNPHSFTVGRWNTECLQCHTTHGRSRLPSASEQPGADSVVAEFGISCEACHGPGEKHVASRRKKLAEHDIINPSHLSPQRSAQVCGRCHAITMPRAQSEYADLFEHGYRFRPGDELSDSTPHVVRRDEASRRRFKAGVLTSDEQAERAFDLQFWKDGMVRVSGREYNGLLDSACHVRGSLSCISCHAMHKPEEDKRSLPEWADDQLRAEALGDAACTACHAAEKFAASEHTHHAAPSAGSRCYNCHMPHTTYGLLKAIRSHTIDRPNVATDVHSGRPNACNLCHLDKTLAWTAEHLSKWYSIAEPELDEDQREISATVLWAAQGDAGQRALAAWHLGWSPAQAASRQEWIAPHLTALLDDPYLAVRHLARRSLRTLPDFDGFDCDTLGTPGALGPAMRRAMETWRESPAVRARREFPAGVLLDEHGAWRQEELNRLRTKRDNRPVSLVE